MKELIRTGRCYPESTLRKLMEFCQKNNIHMISDEVYALSVYDTGFDGPTFTSALSIDPNGLIDKDRLHILYGMSKARLCIPSIERVLIMLSGLWIGRSALGELDHPKCYPQESSCSKHEVS